MSTHGKSRRFRRVIAAILGALLAVVIIAIFSRTDDTSTAAIPAPIPLPGITTPTSTTPAEHHIATAMNTPAGIAAENASNQVNRLRQAASNDPAARDLQARLNAVGGPLMFEPDTATLTPESAAQVTQLADVLRTTPTRVRVVGHTAVEISQPELCLQLSQLRAEQVALRMEIAGIDPSRVTATGISHTQPKDTAAESRRAELIVEPTLN